MMRINSIRSLLGGYGFKEGTACHELSSASRGRDATVQLNIYWSQSPPPGKHVRANRYCGPNPPNAKDTFRMWLILAVRRDTMIKSSCLTRCQTLSPADAGNVLTRSRSARAQRGGRLLSRPTQCLSRSNVSGHLASIRCASPDRPESQGRF